MCDHGLSKNVNQIAYYRSNFKIIILWGIKGNNISFMPQKKVNEAKKNKEFSNSGEETVTSF